MNDKELSMPDLPDLPAHPDFGTAEHPDQGHGSSEPAIGGISRRRKIVIIGGVLALVVLVIVLHLTGVIGAEGN
jgi:hypothetical protein